MGRPGEARASDDDAMDERRRVRPNASKRSMPALEQNACRERDRVISEASRSAPPGPATLGVAQVILMSSSCGFPLASLGESRRFAKPGSLRSLG